MGSALLLTCSCSSGKKQSEPPKKNEGPQQEPFEKPAGMDSEGEEGASLDSTQKAVEQPTFVETEKKESEIFVTPVVVEAVKKEAESTPLVQEISVKEASSLLETISALPLETSPVVQ